MSKKDNEKDKELEVQVEAIETQDNIQVQESKSSLNREELKQKLFGLGYTPKTRVQRLLDEKLTPRETVTLKECIETTRRFYEGNMTTEQFDAWGSKLRIRAYIPIVEKMQIMMNVLMTNQLETGVTSPEIIITELYKEVFYKIVLAGYGNIDLGEADYQTYDNYDLLYPVFNEYITGFCKDDYNTFMNMIRDSMSLYGITNVTDAVEKVDADKIKEATKSNEELLKALRDDRELVDKILDIASFNDPTTKKVVESIKNIGLQQGKKKNKDETENENQSKNEEVKTDSK